MEGSDLNCEKAKKGRPFTEAVNRTTISLSCLSGTTSVNKQLCQDALARSTRWRELCDWSVSSHSRGSTISAHFRTARSVKLNPVR